MGLRRIDTARNFEENVKPKNLVDIEKKSENWEGVIGLRSNKSEKWEGVIGLHSTGSSRFKYERMKGKTGIG